MFGGSLFFKKALEKFADILYYHIVRILGGKLVVKKLIASIIALLMCSTLFFGCAHQEDGDTTDDGTKTEQPSDGTDKEPEKPPVIEDWFASVSADTKANLSAGGYVDGNITDFSQYVGTDAYRTVSTADQLIEALSDAKYHYVTNFDSQTKTFTQSPAEGYSTDNFEGKVHVIEITQDLNLGYYKLSEESKKKTEIVEDFCRRNANQISKFSMSEMFNENGISQIKVENTSNLLVFSKNGSKITHAGFKLTSDTNVVFRNLEFDEIWQWEDSSDSEVGAVGDYDAFGWAYFKIAFCGYVWIDHCTFGKSYDGQIDYSNPVYDANPGTAFRAPYGAKGPNGLHISWCSFNAGSDDENGYLYKMMKSIEDDYNAGGNKNLYYKALRDGGLTFEEILYGIAIPQKKGFLCGDDAKFSGSYDNADDYNFNLKLQISFANCIFKNLEDRLPKLRGGNAYIYNCIVDSSEYYVYRTKLKAKNAASLVQAVNSTWKCALVSQGMLCGNGGSIKAENCIFRGIDSLLKNNDTKNSGVYVQGGYQLINCSYQKAATDSIITGSTTESPNLFPNSSTTTLKTENFKWHTEDGKQPFVITPFALNLLEKRVTNSKYGAGAGRALEDRLLKCDYGE